MGGAGSVLRWWEIFLDRQLSFPTTQAGPTHVPNRACIAQ